MFRVAPILLPSGALPVFAESASADTISQAQAPIESGVGDKFAAAQTDSGLEARAWFAIKCLAPESCVETWKIIELQSGRWKQGS
jgi:hypothetical protein